MHEQTPLLPIAVFGEFFCLADQPGIAGHVREARGQFY